MQGVDGAGQLAALACRRRPKACSLARRGELMSQRAPRSRRSRHPQPAAAPACSPPPPPSLRSPLARVVGVRVQLQLVPHLAHRRHQVELLHQVLPRCQRLRGRARAKKTGYGLLLLPHLPSSNCVGASRREDRAGSYVVFFSTYVLVVKARVSVARQCLARACFVGGCAALQAVAAAGCQDRRCSLLQELLRLLRLWREVAREKPAQECGVILLSPG